MQHPTPRFLQQPFFESLQKLNRARTTESDISPDRTIHAMDAGGIRIGLLSAWWGPGGSLIDNDEVAACLRASPERLYGIASVDLSRPMEAIRELRRAVRELGFRGLRILPWLWNLPPDDRRYYPLYAECVELDIPFCLQAGHTGPRCPSEPGRPIPYLENVALEFPELRIVAGHVGYPWTDEMISLATRFPNVYIDTSAYKASRYPSALLEFMRGNGGKKVMFGSNYPMLAPRDCLRGLGALDLNVRTREQFLFRNAGKVFQLEIDD